MGVLAVPEKKHWHVTPGRARNYPVNTVAECDECGALLVVRDGLIDYGRNWYPLRWYHRKAKKALRESTKRVLRMAMRTKRERVSERVRVGQEAIEHAKDQM